MYSSLQLNADDDRRIRIPAKPTDKNKVPARAQGAEAGFQNHEPI
jgi:hypothetical protein